MLMSATQSTRTLPPMKMLVGKSAIVTGSTSGIGLGVARTLAASGANVLLNGFGDRREIAAICDEIIAESGVAAHYDDADMSKPEAVEGLASHAASLFGNIDIIVNNAGIQHVSPIETFPVAKWDAIVAINLSAAFHLSRAVFAGMKARKWGRIVNVASAHGLVASPFKSAYVAAKHGIVGLTKVIALEGAEAGVTCNAICPGYVWTPLVEKQIEDQAKAHGITREEVVRDVLLAQQPTKRFATVDEIGALALFLCTDAAASITGTALPVDGGWTAH
jgi:3-hydroxybutyrate dehydrogenase